MSQTHPLESSGQCDCGDCAYSRKELGSIPIAHLTDNMKSRHDVLRMPLVRSATLMAEPVHNHIAAFQPEQGRLSVFNRVGYDLMQRFTKPASIDAVLREHRSIPGKSVSQFCLFLRTLGLLRQPTQPEPISQVPSISRALILWLHLTNQCNLNCQYCYVQKSLESMGKTTVEQAIERLFNTAVLKHYKKVTLKYAGGEPTLQPELLMHAHCLAEELSEAHQIDLNAVMLTNGITIPASLLEFSIQHNITWAISLDSLSPARCAMLHGAASSQQVLATLDRFQRNGISPHIIITVNRLNLDELPLLVEFLSERQLRFTINFYRPTKYGTDPSPLRPDNHDLIRTMRNVYAVIENHLPDHSLLSLLLDRVDLSTPHVRACSAGYHYVTIGHHGNVAPCQMLVSQPSAYTTALEPQLPLMPQVQYENFQNPTIFEKEGCDEDCFLRYACAGGCPLDAFHTHGRYNAATSYCEVYRALAPEVLRLEALRLLHYETPVVLGDEH